MSLKEKFDMAVGKTAKFLGEQKDKASVYLSSKQEFYEVKTALDEARCKLDKLFNELGRVCYFGQSTVPDRTKADIVRDIELAKRTVDVLQEKLDNMSVDETE